MYLHIRSCQKARKKKKMMYLHISLYNFIFGAWEGISTISLDYNTFVLLADMLLGNGKYCSFNLLYKLVEIKIQSFFCCYILCVKRLVC